MSFPGQTTDFGFQWGPMTVSRLFSDPKHGVWIEVGGQRESVQIRVTKGGRIRVFNVQKKGKSK